VNQENGTSKIWAYALIALGALLLAANMGWFGAVSNWLWALLFMAGGAAFVYHYLNNRERWWALIPGFALVATGLTMLLGNAGGPIFLALIGAAFLAAFLTNKDRWWALIPGGVLATLAVVNWVELANPRYDAGWLFFLGIAATFGYLYRRPDGGERQPWAVWPAVVGLGMALLGFVNTPLGGLVAPLALIGLGVYLITRRGKPEVPQPPQAGSQP
jgi:hypothetical protein